MSCHIRKHRHMRRAYKRMWKVVPCTSKTMLRTESKKDIEEILKAKLETIKEEPEVVDHVGEEKWAVRLQLQVSRTVKKMAYTKGNKRKGRCFVPKCSSLKESYALFMAAGFASKASSFPGLA